MKRYSVLLLFLIGVFGISSKASTVFDHLRIASSAHINALGGQNISITDPDPLTSHSNPALLAFSPTRSVALCYMNYVGKSNAAAVHFSDIVKDRSAYSAWIQYLDWGTMKSTSELNQDYGTFHAMDMTIAGGYNYLFFTELSGGVNGKVLYSRLAGYSSVALCVDLGLNYWNKDKGISASLAVQNLGGQVKPFIDNYEKIPANLVAGITWKMQHAPISLSVTMPYLNNWNRSSFYSPDGKTLSFGQLFTRHLVLGMDITLSDSFYIALGYNQRTRAELAGSKGLGGLSIGTGLELNRLSVALSFCQYQISTSSLMINFAFNL